NNTVLDHTAGSEWEGTWQGVLAHLSMLLQQSGLSYREYLDMRQISFVEKFKPTLSPPKECKTSKIILKGKPEAFTYHLNCVHLFTRLWRKSGWTMRDLGLALTAFGGQLTPTILKDLALLKRLRAGLGLPVSVLVACIDKLETKEWTNYTKNGTPIEPALYNSVFQRQSLRSLTGFDDFALDKLGDHTLSISDRAFVAASLGIKPDQVNIWIDSSTFSVDDLTNIPSLASKLKLNESPRPVDIWLADQLSVETIRALGEYQGADSDPAPLQTALLLDLNNTLLGSLIYDLHRFDGVVLRAETEKLLTQKPLIGDLVRLNRMLLEDAYLLELLRKPPSLGISDLANVDNLSRLYAAASLCRALRIAPDALPDIVALFGASSDPFHTLPASTTPDERAQQARVRAFTLFEFGERIGFVRESGFDFDTLSYLLRHRVLPGKGSEASTKVEQQLTRMLTELRAALQSGVVLGDVSADNVKRQLALLGWYPALIDTMMGSDGLNYQPFASVDIPPQLEPVFPLNLRSKFAYRKLDSTKDVLECNGSLTDPDFTSIDNLKLFPDGKVTALNTEYKKQLDTRTKTLASLLQIMELAKLPTVTETLTGLAALPDIPGELKDRLKFELDSKSPTQGNLTLTGWLWLSDAEEEAVIKANPLSTVVINLQEKALLKMPTPSSQTSADAEQLLREPDLEKRYRTILLRLVPYLELDLLVVQLSGALGLDPQVVKKLLDTAKVPKVKGQSAKVLLTDSKFLDSGAKSLVNRKTCSDQFEVVELLGKIATIANRLTIKPEQLDWILGKAAFTVMDVLALPTNVATTAVSFDGWRKLVDLFHLRDVLPDGPARLTRIYTALSTSDFAAVRKEFADAYELSVSDVDGACSPDLLAFNGAAPGDYKNPSRLLALAQLLHVIKALGTTSINITQLIRSAPDKSVAQLARTLFAASINAEEFPERLRPISNRLRNLQRDALVAYLIHRDHLADSNELFDRYLIDVEMGFCMLTSRLKQAISSVQLFVQRCLLNLERPANSSEPGVSPGSIDSQRWQWMKYYRVWEANRKVFLYPENWIEPELRDDKTEIFQAFESDLLQSEITHDTALLAFRNYLDKMGDVVNLTVVSMFEEQLLNSKGDVVKTIVHCVGRDNSQPYKHYYRQWKMLAPIPELSAESFTARLPIQKQDFGTWTAWEEISIQADSDHMMVFLFGGSVYLAWPSIFAQGSNQKWQIRLNLAKRSASGWTKLKKGRGEIEIPMMPNIDENSGIAFRTRFNNDETVSIVAFGPNDQTGTLELNSTDGPREEIKRWPGSTQLVNPHLDLKLRVLASYTYTYADGSTKKRYRLATDLNLNIQVKYLFTNAAGTGENIAIPDRSNVFEYSGL
ncbi:hypothetical protein MTYM_02050, partial [Methylococcales bacterium]